MARTPTGEYLGIPQVDKLLSTIPVGSTILLVNDPGIEAEPFLYQAANEHLKQGTTVIYAVFNRYPSSVVRAMKEFGFDTDAHRSRLMFLDGFSSLMGTSEGAAFSVRDPRELKELADLIGKLSEQHKDAVLILDPISTLIDQTSLAAFNDALRRLQPAMKRFRLSVALLTRWPYGEDLTPLQSAFDGLITLHGVEERVILNQYFTVQRAAWAGSVDRKPILFKTVKPGGVFVYIPKILVTGPYHAGKSTFVQTLSDTAVSVNRLGTTVAMDHGHVTIDGLTTDVFGTPGQERFDPLLKTLAGQALGVIVVVDSTKPETIARAKEMMKLTGREGLPTIIAANKQDLPNALAPAEVAKRLGTPAHIKVVGCRGQDRESTQKVLRELIGQIMSKVTS